MWSYAALFASWRANAEANKALYSLQFVFTDIQNGIGREFIVFLIYGIATYVSVKKFGRTVKGLSGPIVVVFLSLLFQMILRFANKWFPDGDTSVGNKFQDWYSEINQEVFLGDNSAPNTINLLAVAIGYLAAA
jgi:hypothetical protein